MSGNPANGDFFNGESISNGSSITSEKAFDIKELELDGFFSLQVETVGAGSIVQLELLGSNDGVTFQVPKTNGGTAIKNIADAHSEGIDLYGFPQFPVCRKFKIKATASGADVESITTHRCVQ